MKIENRLEKIVELLIKEIAPKRIILFGSRARDLNRLFSDIDLAIEGGKKVSFRELRKIKEKIEDISGIYSVDLVFLERIEPEFKKIILETGRLIYEES